MNAHDWQLAVVGVIGLVALSFLMVWVDEWREKKNRKV